MFWNCSDPFASREIRPHPLFMNSMVFPSELPNCDILQQNSVLLLFGDQDNPDDVT